MEPKNDLMEKLASPDNLLAAWRAVRGNIPSYRRQRSAGPDGVSLAEFERDLPAQLNALRHALLTGDYQPNPPTRFELEKRNGGARQIVILNVADRVAQRAAQQVIEPLFEPSFLPCSFGFRPGRSVNDAVYCARRLRQHGHSWVVDGDIAACFDHLDHQLLMHRLEKQIRDRRVQDLVKKWLKTGMMRSTPPQKDHNWLADGLEKASNGLQRGIEWTLSTLAQSSPHEEFRYEPARGHYLEDGLDQELITQHAALASIEDESEVDWYDYRTNSDERRKQTIQRQALQQITASGMILGSGWVRRSLSKMAPTVIQTIKSAAGRRALSRGLLAGGGAVGVAASVAVAAYCLYRQAAPKLTGVLQGSPLSPLLANIYLHPFDLSITKAGLRLVRYADDWVILCQDQAAAESAYNRAVLTLANIRLKINTYKTKILSPDDRLEWLGEVIEGGHR